MEKSVDDFTPLSKRPGWISYCRPCNAEYVNQRNSDPETKARNAARQRERRKDPDKVTLDRATSKAWKTRNPERAKAHYGTPEKVAYNKAWRAANRDRDIAASRRYQAKNPEISKVSQARRRARKLAAVDALTQAQWRQILDDFGHRCAYCLRDDLPLQQEHMTPLSRGGEHSASNVVPSCPPCNYRKHTRTLLEFTLIGACA